MSDVDDTIAFCKRLDPLFEDRLRGAAADALDRLRQRAPLQPVHVEFLQRMGTEAPGVELDAMDMTVQGLLDAYEKTEGQLPEGMALLGVAEDDPWFDLVLDGATVGVIPSCVGGDFDEASRDEVRPVAGSLPELLCLRFLEESYGGDEYRYERRAGQVEVEPDALRRAEGVATREGFVLSSLSNEATRVLLRDKVLLIVRQFPGRALRAAVHASSPAGVNEVITLLQRAVHVEPAPASFPVRPEELAADYRARARRAHTKAEEKVRKADATGSIAFQSQAALDNWLSSRLVWQEDPAEVWRAVVRERLNLLNAYLRNVRNSGGTLFRSLQPFVRDLQPGRAREASAYLADWAHRDTVLHAVGGVISLTA